MSGLVLFWYSGYDACLSCRDLCYSGIVVMMLACHVGVCVLFHTLVFRYSGYDACLSCRSLWYSGIVVMMLACHVGACVIQV